MVLGNALKSRITLEARNSRDYKLHMIQVTGVMKPLAEAVQFLDPRYRAAEIS